jgi:hypothetical protein
MKIVKYKNKIEYNRALNGLFFNGYQSLDLKTLYVIVDKGKVIGAFNLDNTRYNHLLVPDNLVKFVLDYVKKKVKEVVLCCVSASMKIRAEYNKYCKVVKAENGLTWFAI